MNKSDISETKNRIQKNPEMQIDQKAVSMPELNPGKEKINATEKENLNGEESLQELSDEFKAQYTEQAQQDLPDLWARIESALPEKAKQSEIQSEKRNEKQNEKQNEIQNEKIDEKQTSGKQTSGKQTSGKQNKKKKLLNWRRWTPVLAACACLAVFLPVFFLLRDKGGVRTETAAVKENRDDTDSSDNSGLLNFLTSKDSANGTAAFSASDETTTMVEESDYALTDEMTETVEEESDYAATDDMAETVEEADYVMDTGQEQSSANAIGAGETHLTEEDLADIGESFILVHRKDYLEPLRVSPDHYEYEDGEAIALYLTDSEGNSYKIIKPEGMLLQEDVHNNGTSTYTKIADPMPENLENGVKYMVRLCPVGENSKEFYLIRLY